MNRRKNAKVVILENSQTAVTSTKFWNFNNLEKFLVQKLENYEKRLKCKSNSVGLELFVRKGLARATLFEHLIIFRADFFTVQANFVCSKFDLKTSSREKWCKENLKCLLTICLHIIDRWTPSYTNKHSNLNLNKEAKKGS